MAKNWYQIDLFKAVENLNQFSIEVNKWKKYLFAGFNALNAAEEKIIQHLIAAG
jgi:hypothetical protein